MSEMQNEYFPESVSAPGETLIEMLDDRSMTQTELASRTGRPLKTINEIVKGVTAITPETALQLERVLGVKAEFWNNREAAFRQYVAKKDEYERLKKRTEWLSKFPVNDMAKLGWVRRFKQDQTAQVIELLNFFGVASPQQWHSSWKSMNLSFKRTSRFKNEQEATSAWLRKGEIEAREIQCESYDIVKFKAVLKELRALTQESDTKVFLPKLVSMCAEAGVAVVLVPGIKGAPVCGVARWLSPNKALIQLSLRYKTDDHLWFSFFHEAGHLLLHSKKTIFVELNNSDSENHQELEGEANAFAADNLIEPKMLKEFLESSSFTKVNVKRFAQEAGVSPGIVVGRLQHEGLLPRSYLNDLKRRYKWVHEGQ